MRSWNIALIVLLIALAVAPTTAITLDNGGGHPWKEQMGFPTTTTPTTHSLYKIVINGSTWRIYNATDYLETSGNNTNFWSLVQPNGTDIRVFNQSKQLYFWIEYFNATEQKAVIWVNLTAGSSELNVAYGNPNATKSEYMDYTHVFILYDNFNRYVRWGVKYSNNPIVTPNPALNQAGARYPCVIYDAEDGKYKMWYDVLSENSPSYNITIWYAESVDGINWTNHQKVFEGTGVAGDFDSVSVSVGTVIKENGTYYMWYTGRPVTGCGSNSSYGIGLAYSTDGIHWSRSPNNPLLLAKDFGCTFISGSTVIHDTDGKWRMVFQSDRDGHLKLYRAESDFPDKNWTFYPDPIIINPTGSANEVNEGKLIKIGSRYYMIHPYDKGGGCYFTASYSYSDDFSNWNSCVEDLLSYEGGVSGIKHFLGILVPNHDGGNYVFPNKSSVDLYLYYSHGCSYGGTCSDDTDWRISLAFFDSFPTKKGLDNWSVYGNVDLTDGWLKMHGTNANQAITLLRRIPDAVALEFDWKYPDNPTDYKEIFVNFRAGEENSHHVKFVVAGYDTSNKIWAEKGLSGNTVDYPFNSNTVYHIKLIRKNGFVNVFINDKNIVTYTYNTAEIATKLQLGSVDQNDYGNWFDNVKIYSCTDSANFGVPLTITNPQKKSKVVFVKAPSLFEIGWHHANKTLDELTFMWDFNNDGKWDVIQKGNNVTEFTFTRPDSYLIKVGVSDGNITVTSSTIIQVISYYPIVGANNYFNKTGVIVWANASGTLAKVQVKPKKATGGWNAIVLKENTKASRVGDTILDVFFLNVSAGTELYLEELVESATTVDLLHNGEPLYVNVSVGEDKIVNFTLDLFSRYTIVVNESAGGVAAPSPPASEQIILVIVLVLTILGAVILLIRKKVKEFKATIIDESFRFFRKI